MGGNSFGTADRLGAKSRSLHDLIGWNMSVEAKGSDSASDHNQVSLKRNQSKTRTVSESGIMGVNCSSWSASILSLWVSYSIMIIMIGKTEGAAIYSDGAE